MPKLELLVATMNQSNLRKYHDMKIKSDVVFANQTDSYSYIEETISDNRIRMISTNERGVGKNRNLALILSEAEICLLSDDDVTYVDEYEKIVLDAFTRLPMADIIIFNIQTIGKKVNRRINKGIKRVRIYNFLNYGAVRIAFRRDNIIRKNIWFSLKFGGGAAYSAGEDSLFLREALKKNLKLYTYPVNIANVKQENSTWFNGYTEKYFFDKGAFLSAAFPLTNIVFIIYYSLRFSVTAKCSFIRIFINMMRGTKAYSQGICYEQK